MKKLSTITIILALIFFSFVSCGKKVTAPKAGSASANDMLNFVPVEAKGVIMIDFHRAMSTEIARKAIEEDKNYKKYQEFVNKTGVDPQKDVYFVTVAVTEAMEKGKTKGSAIINLKYNKENLLSLIKQQEGELTEEDYNGFTIYSSKKEDEGGCFSFLDDSNAVVGNEAGVKSVIDVLLKKKDNVFKNQALSSLMAKTNKEAMLWGAFIISPQAIEKITSQNPMLSNLKAVDAAILYFDYQNKNIMAEIKVMSSDEQKNQQIADLLNGVKAMGGMAAAKKPEIGEFINKIEISSAPDHVKVYAKIPEELINKLKEMKATEKKTSD